MAWYWGDDIAIGGFVVLIVGWLLVTFITPYDGWRVKSNSGLIIFRKPLGQRIFLLLFGIWLVVGPLLLAAGGADGWSQLSVQIVCGCLLGLFLLWLAVQRYELCLDIQTQTYRLTRGWLLWPKVRSGPWEDFGGVFVRGGGTGSDSCSLGLAWSSGAEGCLYLGGGLDSAKADAEAQSIAATLRLPRVTAPPPEGFRGLLK